jgi:hypothetical protein
MDSALRLLAFDPTPAMLVGNRSLRLALKSEWARIRKWHFKKSDVRCVLCGAEREDRRKIDGHEAYSFPSAAVVRLERILFVCKPCHDAIHLERTRRECGPAYVTEVEAHYCRVNGGISRDEMERDFVACMRRSTELSRLYGPKPKPRIDLGDYQAGADEAYKRKRDDDDDNEFETYPDHECPWDVGHAD